jgi:hypothetical protein
MAELNSMLSDVQTRSADLKKVLIDLFTTYEDLYRQSNRLLQEERQASDGKMAGMETFYMMVQTIRRNRDIVGSMIRGVNGIRSLSAFKVIEQEVEEEPKKKKEPEKATPEDMIVAPPEEVIMTQAGDDA